MHINKEQLAELKKEGFIVIKNVLSKSDLERLREITTDFFTNREGEIAYLNSGKTKPDAFNAIPELAFIFNNDKIKGIMRDICGEHIRYGHHSDIHYNMLSGWHKDNYGDNDWATEDGGETYNCYKMAFYLQDHTNNKEGLTVRRGSHLHEELHAGELYDIPSEAGDAVVFDMRISHVGKEARLPEQFVKFLFKSNKKRFEVFQTTRKIRGIQDKISVFFAFGQPSHFMEEHIHRNIDRQNKQNESTDSYKLNPKVADELEKAHVDYTL